MVRIAILGGSGYTSLELIRLLLRHPSAKITAVTSRTETDAISKIHPSLTGRLDLKMTNPSPEELAEIADVAFCCLPHCASMQAVPSLLAAGLKVIDLSADYRLNDPKVYEQWYGHVHTDPTRLSSTVYGLAELYREQIPGEQLIANPGCYTSTSILALAPLLKDQLVKPTGIIIDAKSGVSGAGRSLKLEMLYSEANESLAAYAVGTHRHQPEIEQVLSDFSGQQVDVIFTPHLTPMDRGIFATIYANPTHSDLQLETVFQSLERFYENQPFVKVVRHVPKTKDVAGTNFCHVTARLVKDRVVVMAVLDNLVKGASGVAVQNFNLMFGFNETTALI